MYIPATRREAEDLYGINLDWERMDVVLVTGDSYIDSPFIGVSVIGQVLMDAGYKVGIIPQPDIRSQTDIARFGEPLLFWGVTAGNIDSMVANYTATGRKRMQDDFTAGGKNTRRPDRASIVYANLIRRNFSGAPVVLGGLEASLRRIAHYDFWSDSVRRSVLSESGADYLVYGMADKTVLTLAERLSKKRDAKDVPGVCYLAEKPIAGYAVLPSYDEAKKYRTKFTEMFRVFYANQDAATAKGLCQLQDGKWLVQNPPALPLNTKELDAVYRLEFERNTHPVHQEEGPVRALETIRFSIATHRGCFGECNFCSITMHQGRTIAERSEASILEEAETISKLPGFKGYILDAGGPTANMYGMECRVMKTGGKCSGKKCLGATVCRNLDVSHGKQINLLEKIRKIPGIKKVFVASGIRYDLVLEDRKDGGKYLEELVQHHVSGQLKIAPEHTVPKVLRLMNKPGVGPLLEFKERFDGLNRRYGKKQFLTYYFIAAHPGCGMEEMHSLKSFLSKELKTRPEQVQIFMPTPSTWSTLMYYTGKDPFGGGVLFTERDVRKKQAQKDLITPQNPSTRGFDGSAGSPRVTQPPNKK